MQSRLERLRGKALRLFEAGKYEASRKWFERLVAESMKMRGPDHEQTLLARASLANTYGHKPKQGIVLLEELLGDMGRVFDAEDQRLFPVRADLAAMYGNSGDHATANALAKELVTDVERLSGPDDPQAQAARETVFVSEMELARAAAEPAYRELGSLMDLSVEGFSKKPTPADWQQDLALTLSQLEESLSFRSRRIGRFIGPESGTIEWSLDYVRPDRFHVVQIAFEVSENEGLYDEWITIGSDHYQNTGVWIKETVPDMFEHEFGGLNPLLRGDGYVQLARIIRPDRIFKAESPEGEYLLVSFASAPPDLTDLMDVTVTEAETILWVDLRRMILARADFEISGHQEGAEIQASFTHGFTSYGADIAIPEPPEGHFIDASTQS